MDYLKKADYGKAPEYLKTVKDQIFAETKLLEEMELGDKYVMCVRSEKSYTIYPIIEN